ncbi:MAG: methyltransferase [Candidatus Aminicenantes bacterium]|nr:methyltransferase [Candidatus Aminicenantes bacterium]
MNTQPKKEGESLDTFYRGRIRILQKTRGYRFSIEAPLLAGFIETDPEDEVLELGTANGIVSLLLSVKPFKSLTALEIQVSLAELARRNVRLNHLQDRIKIVRQDLKKFNPAKKYDIVFANPPYFEQNIGRLSESMEISIAKHEIKCNIFDVMKKTAELLRDTGQAYFIFSFRRRADFIKALNTNRLQLNKERHIVPYKGLKPNLFLSKCGFKSDTTNLLPPLVLYNDDGRYSQEAERIFSG